MWAERSLAAIWNAGRSENRRDEARLEAALAAVLEDAAIFPELLMDDGVMARLAALEVKTRSMTGKETET